jgi:DNA-binding transcriptional MerR regulator
VSASPRHSTQSVGRAARQGAGPRTAPLPEKLFYKIGEVGRLAGLETYVLRYWETEFPALHPRKTAGGQRVYTKQDVELVLQIKQMLHEQGFTIAGARKRLRSRLTDPAEQRAVLGQIRGQLQSILDDLRACAPRPVSAKPGAGHERRGRS